MRTLNGPRTPRILRTINLIARPLEYMDTYAQEYLPFGGGNRRCIGMAFAQMEMKLVLATVLSRFQLALVDHRPIKPVRRGLTAAPPAGLRMIATSQRHE